MRAEDWVVAHTSGAPERLIESMLEAVREVAGREGAALDGSARDGAGDDGAVVDGAAHDASVRKAHRSPIPQQLANAAMLLYNRVTESGEGREAALPLLAADALLTHAFEAQAELDPDGLDDFALVQARADRLAQMSR